MKRREIAVNPWWTLSVLCLSLVMVVLGNTVLNVALPTLIRELGATSTQLQWMVDSYALVFAGLLLTAGALGDRFGRKGALIIGLVIFGGASLASAFATSPNHLIATRAIMGLASALVMPATLSILVSVFTPERRGRAIAIWAGFAGVGGAIGPIAGGWLLEHFYWGSVFLLNLPVVAVALVAGRRLVPRSRDPHQSELDPVGASLSIVGFGALLYGIIEGPNYGWTDPQVVSSFGVAAVSLIAFGMWELRSAHPMLDLTFFKDRRFSAASGAIAIVFLVMFGTFFLVTQYLQFVRAYSPLEAGVRMLPLALTMMVAAPTSARVVERVGARRVVSLGLATVAVGLALATTVGVDTPYGWLAVVLIVQALGMSLTMAPSTTLIMASVPPGKSGVGSAWNDTTRELGGALGVAILGSLATSQYVASLRDSTSGFPATLAAAAEASVGSALQASERLPADLGRGLAEAARTAFVDGMGLAFGVAAVLALAASVAVGMYLPNPVAGGETATRTTPSDHVPVGSLHELSRPAPDMERSKA